MTNYPSPQAILEMLERIRKEYYSARGQHTPLASGHEGYAVLLEELDEAWDEIKRDDIPAAKREMLQVAAMALAFLLEVE